MPLTDFNDNGDLPEGVHQTAIDEFIARWQIKRDRTLRGIIEVRP